jgi:hypothetical protein
MDNLAHMTSSMKSMMLLQAAGHVMHQAAYNLRCAFQKVITGNYA